MDEVREEESAQVGKTRVEDILLAETMPLTEGETSGIEEESAQVGKTRVEDILLAETMPLSEDEYSGIELVGESEEEIDVEGIHQTHDVPTPTTRHDPAPNTPQDTNATNASPNEVCEPGDKQQNSNDPSPGTSSGIIRCTPRPDSELQSIQSIITNNTKEDRGWDSQLSPAEVIMDNLDHIDSQVLETLVKNALENKEKITLQNGRQLVLGRDWGREIVIPHRNKGRGKSTTQARQESARREHECKPSGQEAGNEEKRPNARPGEEPENITIAENVRRRQGRDREEEEDTQLDPNLPGQEEVHEEKLHIDQEIDQ